MKLNIDFGELSFQAKRMGEFQRIALPEKKFTFEPVDVGLEGCVEIDPRKYETRGDVLLSYSGRHVVLYIKDHSFISEIVFQRSRGD